MNLDFKITFLVHTKDDQPKDRTVKPAPNTGQGN